MKNGRPDVPAMIFGVIFMGIAGLWFGRGLFGWGAVPIYWLLAAVLILLGAAGIASALRNARE
jgi:hypothetical protein